MSTVAVSAPARRLPLAEAAGLVLLLAVVGYVYWGTFGFFWQRWNHDAQYSLGYLVPLVALALVWTRRKELRAVPRRPASAAGLAVLLVAALLHLASGLLDIRLLSCASFLLLIPGSLLFLHSWALVRMLAFPLAFLLFALPVPEGIIDMLGFPLQLGASKMTTMLLGIGGIPVEREGVNMAVPGFRFEVAVACSGMSSLVALLGVSAIFTYLSGLPVLARWILFAAAVPIALLANTARVLIIALMGYYLGAKTATDFHDNYASPLLFSVALVLLFALRSLLAWLFPSEPTDPPTAEQAAPPLHSAATPSSLRWSSSPASAPASPEPRMDDPFPT